MRLHFPSVVAGIVLLGAGQAVLFGVIELITGHW